MSSGKEMALKRVKNKECRRKTVKHPPETDGSVEMRTGTGPVRTPAERVTAVSALVSALGKNVRHGWTWRTVTSRPKESLKAKQETNIRNEADD